MLEHHVVHVPRPEKRVPVEGDTILGNLLEHGRSHRVDTPLLQVGCVRLRVYQNTSRTLAPPPDEDQQDQRT
jgi:hypothetical protein